MHEYPWCCKLCRRSLPNWRSPIWQNGHLTDQPSTLQSWKQWLCYTSPAIAHGWTKSVNADGIHGMVTFNAACKEVKTTVSTVKVIATIFWDIHTIILIVDFMPRSVTVTRAAYQVSLQCLKEAIQHWWLGLLTLSVLLMHNNARLHTSHSTVALLDTWHWEYAPHPRYSLTSSDFHTFSNWDTSLKSVISICQHCQSWSPGVAWRAVSSTAKAWQISYRMKNAWRSLPTMWKKNNWSPSITMRLSPLTSIHLKQIGNLGFQLSLICYLHISSTSTQCWAILYLHYRI